MSRPDVIIQQTDGNLGRVSPNNDGVSALIVSAVAIANQFDLGEILTLFSLQDAIDLGINDVYDQTNSLLTYQHIKEFYKASGDGVKLYVLPVDRTILISALVDKTQNYAQKLFTQKKDIKICIVTRLPEAGYTPVYNGQFDADIIAAVTKSQELIESEKQAPRHRYKQIIIEGYDFQGNPSITSDFRALNSDRVSVVCGADNLVSNIELNAIKPYFKYAFAAFIGGLRAKLTVQRNIGRVKNGNISIENVGLSNGQKVNDFTDVQLETLHGKGLIFAWEHQTKAGFYINQDHVCTKITSDYAYSPNGRLADKVSRITREVYIDELLDDIEVNPTTGRLEVSITKAFQEKLKKELNKNLISVTPKEASFINVFVDPNQNILASDQLEVEVDIIPKGYANTILVKQSFINPFNN